VDQLDIRDPKREEWAVIFVRALTDNQHQAWTWWCDTILAARWRGW
jgi:hypothetical protein